MCFRSSAEDLCQNRSRLSLSSQKLKQEGSVGGRSLDPKRSLSLVIPQPQDQSLPNPKSQQEQVGSVAA
eukprot:76745-Prorocentrum_lima.AAC.1